MPTCVRPAGRQGRVITGAGSGIGLATARRFAAEGAKVVCADVDEAAGQGGGRRGRRPVRRGRRDLRGPTCGRCSPDAVSHLRRLDIAFNNAGISPPDDDSILTTGLDAWRRVQEVNLTSVYLCCKYAIAHMRARRQRLDHQHRVVRRHDGRGDLADLLHRQQGRRAGDEPRARRAVRPRGHPGQRAVPGPGQHARCCRSCSPRTRSGRPAGWCTSRWAASPSRRRSPRRSRSWPATTRRSSPRRPSWSTAASAAPTSPRCRRRVQSPKVAAHACIASRFAESSATL